MKIYMRSIARRMRGIHSDEGAQSLVISALFVTVLIALLTVTLNLSTVTYGKIRAQNAADAAAMTGGTWQIRGLNFVQNMNNIIYALDVVADISLTGAVACNAVAWNPIGLAAGNILLTLSVGSHGVAQYIFKPFRYVSLEYLIPVISYISGSQMAAANGATTLCGIGPIAGRLLNEVVERFTDPLEKFIGVQLVLPIGNFPYNIPFYAIGIEFSSPESSSDKKGGSSIGTPGFLSLHLEEKVPEYTDWPLKVSFVRTRVDLCQVFSFGYWLASTYYKFATTDDMGGTWSHSWYESESESVPPDPMVELPPVTWISCVREEERPGGHFEDWTGIWKAMGGLGVPTGQKKYGELGCVAVASTKVYAPRVVKIKMPGKGGIVVMVPACAGKDKPLLEYGVCH